MRGSRDPFIIPGAAPDKRQGTITDQSFASEVSEAFLVGENTLWLGRLFSPVKLRALLAIVVLFFLILGGRLFYLQVLAGSHFRGLAENNRLKVEILPAARGIIFDRFSVPLVANIPTFSLFFQPMVYQSHLTAAQKEALQAFLLSDLNLSTSSVAALVKTESYLPVPLKENLSYEEALKTMLKIKEFSPLKIIIDPKRQYRANTALGNLLGYASRITPAEKDKYLALNYQLTDRVGRVGLEEYYQDKLHGQDGQKQIEVDAFGRENKIVAEQPPENGQNLILSIDAGLQEKIYQTLKSQVPGRAGAVVAMDPRNGHVRALVSWPTFDGNLFSQGISMDNYQSLLADPLKPLYNRAIAGEYPSGSTIKLIMSLAGLEESVINQNTQVNSVGGVWYDKWFFPDWKAGGHGLTNVIKALSESVNTFFYYLALDNLDGHHGLGLDRMVSYFTRFGLGKVLGIDLGGERSGFVPTKQWKEQTKGEAWYPGDTLHLAIGQGDLLVTPLQVAFYTGVIANGGTLYQPQLVEKIINPKTSTETAIEPCVLAKGLGSRDNLAIVASGLRAAVTSGSARGLNLVGAAVAAKTGTAQANSNQQPHAWATAFLPYDNPELVLTVLVENGGEGSGVAIPVARDVLTWYVQNRLK
ncbi:MAG: penicillin-binding protein 2 [Candidatus Komeilibacteria bacterium]|nr:penicillin-binding protein 2 [Candidatus Komeilibacteria bacterium]